MADPRDEIRHEQRILPPTVNPSLRLGQVFGPNVDHVTKLDQGGKANIPTDRVADGNAGGTPQEGSGHSRLRLERSFEAEIPNEDE
jgi:hypothetical protein